MQILRAMSAEAKLGVLALLTALALLSPSITGHTSQTIVNPYNARVVIHNDTGVAIHYTVKWGPSGEWKTITVNKLSRSISKARDTQCYEAVFRLGEADAFCRWNAR